MLFFWLCVVSLLQEHSDIDNDELCEGEGGEGNQERRTANNNNNDNRPSHARKPKEGNGICLSLLFLKCML
jgi:hypothetical protein